VDPGRASRQEIGALERRVCDAELCNRFRIVGAPIQLALELCGDRGAAHFREALDLAVVRDRHDARHDRHGDAGGARRLDELEVELVVEEQLRDQECGAGLIDLAVESTGIFLRGPQAKVSDVRKTLPFASKLLRIDLGPVWVVGEMADARKLAALEPDMAALALFSLDHEATGVKGTARLQVMTLNQPGSLGSLSTVIGREGGNITDLRFGAKSDDLYEIVLDVEVDDRDHMDRIMAGLRASPVVTAVERMQG